MNNQMKYVISAINKEMTVSTFSKDREQSDIFMKSPRVIDGMGDAVVIKACSETGKDVYKMMAELIEVEFEDSTGKTIRKSFWGGNSYRIQDAIENLLEEKV
jgi:hypothetical protein